MLNSLSSRHLCSQVFHLSSKGDMKTLLKVRPTHSAILNFDHLTNKSLYIMSLKFFQTYIYKLLSTKKMFVEKNSLALSTSIPYMSIDDKDNKDEKKLTVNNNKDEKTINLGQIFKSFEANSLTKSYYKRNKQSMNVEIENLRERKNNDDLVKYLNKDNYEASFKIFKQLVNDGFYPPFDISLKLVKLLSLSGELESFNFVKSVLAANCQGQFIAARKLLHYELTTMFHSGRHQEALDKIENHLKRTQKDDRRRTINNLNMLLLKVPSINDRQLDEKAERLVFHLSETVGYKSSLLSLWKAYFCSEKRHYQRLADEYLERDPDLVKALPKKLPVIINSSVTDGEKEVLNRLLVLLLKYGFKDYIPLATSALLTVNSNLKNGSSK